MSANANDLFQYVGDPGTATTLSAPGYTSGGTSINVGSTTNFPTTTGVIFAIDETETVDGEEARVAGTYNVYRGTVATGTSINNLAWVTGDGDRDYAAGSGTRVYITTSAGWADNLIDGLLVSHDQDGTLKAGAVDNADVLASNVVETAKIADGAVTTAKIAAKPAFSARVTSGQSISATTYTKVNFTTEEYDYGSYYDAANSKFTAPYTGVYHFNGVVAPSSTMVAGVYAIYVNGSIAKRPAFSSVASTATSLSVDILLTAGDYAEFYAYFQSGITTSTSATQSYFSGHLVTLP